MIVLEQTIGVILAGGLSRRMEGREKSLLDLGEESLISRVAARLKDQVPEVIVNANGEAARFNFLGLHVQEDTIGGYAGPLAGVLAGMNWTRHNRPDATHVLTAAADTPYFPRNYAKEMIGKINQQGSGIALAGSNRRHHPVFGIWPADLHDALETFLVEESNRKVMVFVERYKNCRVDFDCDGHDPFFNVNTPEDLEMAKNLLDRNLS